MREKILLIKFVEFAEKIGERDPQNSSTKMNLPRGKKRGQGSYQSEKDRSEIRKKKLKQVTLN